MSVDAASSPRPVISVAMATYNGARYLSAQLESIYLPCAVPLEVVVSDDGSTDGTSEILQTFVRRRGLRDVSDGIRRGLVKNFEHALRHCRGDFVALADQDDVWMSGRLDFLSAEIGRSDAIYSTLEKILRPDGLIGQSKPRPGYLDFVVKHGDGSPVRQLIASNWVVGHTMLFRRDVLEAALPIPEAQPYHDGWIALAAAARGGIRRVRPNLTLYREHVASLTAAATKPANRRWRGLDLGLTRAEWENKCRREMARLGSCANAAFLGPDERAFATNLRRYYERGLRRGFSLKVGLRAIGLVQYFQFNAVRRLRYGFVLRGFLGGI